MNILIDFTQIPLLKVGVGVYGEGLVKSIKLCEGDHCFVLVQDDDNCLDSVASEVISIIKVKSTKCRKLLYRFIMEQFYIPFLVIKYKINLIHSLHYSFPIFAMAKKVVTIHDMIFYKYPKFHLRSKVLYFRFFLLLASIFADKIICVSKSTKLDFVNQFDVSDDLISVVELGVDQLFNPDISNLQIMSVKHKYGVLTDYILFIGTLEPRKNINNLILAFAKISYEFSELRLVVVGKKGWHYQSIFNLVEELNITNKVIFTGFVPENEKPPLLAGSRLFVYPSFYEGFGIPILESMACGTPTITSNLSSMPEVAGDAAVLINPHNINEIASAIRKLLMSKEFCKELRVKGILQASRFSWELTAKKTYTVYQALIPSKINL